MFFNLSKGRTAPSDNIPVHRSVTGIPWAGGRESAFSNVIFSMEDGPMFDPYKVPGSRSLHERKLATWALLIGETHSSAVHAETRRRPHRGMLPDVDFSRAVPDYSRPSLVRRIMRLAGLGGGKAEEQGSLDKTIGDRQSPAYSDRDETCTPDDSSGVQGLARAA